MGLVHAATSGTSSTRTWIAARDGSSERQIGAACLEPEKHLWGERFPEQPDGYEEK